MASAGAGPGLNPASDPLGLLSPIPGGGPAVLPGHQPVVPIPLTGGWNNGILYPVPQGMPVPELMNPQPLMTPPGTPGWTPHRPPQATGQGSGFMPSGVARTPLVWYVRKTGSNSNGGTSPNVIQSGSDGVTTTGLSVFTSASMNAQQSWAWNQAININGNVRLVQAVLSATTIIYSGPSIGGGASLPWVVGGAFQTIGFSLGQFQPTAWPIGPGDTIYVGAGTYRETVGIYPGYVAGTSGAPGMPVQVIGDYTGQFTGDPGLVRWTNGSSNDTMIGQVGILGSQYGGYGWVRFYNFYMDCRNGGAIGVFPYGMGFINCTIIAPFGRAFTITGGTVTAGGLTYGGIGFLIDGCVILAAAVNTGAISITGSGVSYSGPPPDINMVIRNSLIISTFGTVIGVSAPTGLTGGMRIYNCTLVGTVGVNIASGSWPSDVPAEVHNCIILATTALNAGQPGQILESHNLLLSSSPRVNVNPGVGSVSDGSYAPMLSLGQELMLGLPPVPFLSPIAGSPALGFGAEVASLPGVAGLVTGYNGAATAYPNKAQYGTLGPPAVDAGGRVRPSGGFPLTAAGYLERHDFAIQDTVTYYDAPASGVLVGPGDQEIRVPVDAVSNTIAIQLRYDGNYTGPMPQVMLVPDGEIGVQGQVQSAPVGNPSTWQQVTLTAFTPTAASWVVLRIISYDTSGIGRVNFDTLTVT